VRFGFGDSPDESLKKAFELGEKATSINSELPDVHSFWNTVYLIEGHNEKAIVTLNRWIFENRIISEYYSHLTLIKSNQK
jgi:hypothetical protein